MPDFQSRARPGGPPAPRWDQRTALRLAAFGLAAGGAIYVGFLAVPVRAAEGLIRHWGYFIMAGTFAGWAVALWRSGIATNPGPWHAADRRAVWGCAGLIAFFSLLAYVHEPLHSRILYDEFVIQSTAYNMHFFREISTMVRGYEVLGTFTSLQDYLDKRPYFFQFLLSLVHDLTGYRPLNAYLLNAVLYPVTLGLVAGLGRQLTGWRGAALLVALLGSLPLLSQTASGSSLELLNFALIVLSAALGARYLAAPDETRLAALLFTVVLLAQTRYESALYLGPAAAVGLLGWWRGRRVILPWAAVLVPVLLIPIALHNKVLSNSPALWELKENQSSRFSLEYLTGNLHGAARFLFAVNDYQQANSLFLVGAGLIGAAWVLLRAWRAEAWRRLTPAQLSILWFGGGILANTILIQFYYWASFDDVMAARFALPFLLLLALAALPLASALDRRWPVSLTATVCAVVYTLGWVVPRQASHRYSNPAIQEIEWEQRVVAARPPVPRIVVTNKTPLPWLLERVPAVFLPAARGEADRLRGQLDGGEFSEILVTQELRPTSADGGHELVPEDRLPASFHLELIAEHRFATKIARISRLVGIEPPAVPDPARVAGAGPEAEQ